MKKINRCQSIMISFAAAVLIISVPRAFAQQVYFEESVTTQQADEGGVFDAARTLKAGDRIKLTIYPIDEHLTGGEMQISPEGNITLPLIGKYSIADKTIMAASRELVSIIDKDYLVDPEVVIEVLNVRKTVVRVSILGAVRQPGNYDVIVKGTKVTLLQAILHAGGFSDVANIKKIKIIRKQNGQNQSIHVNAVEIIGGEKQDVQLEQEDIIHVSESLF